MNRLISVILMIFLSGCASSPEQFERMKYTMSDIQLCRTAVAAKESSDQSFRTSVQNESIRRGIMTYQRCVEIVNEADNRIYNIFSAGIGAYATYNASKYGGYIPNNNYDFEWDWDLFYNQYNQLVWACRGVQTGRFAEYENCSTKMKNDNRWPSLSATTN